MLTPPPIPTHRIAAHLRAAYALPAARITFLPLGADANTAVYRVEDASGAPYFFKLRLGNFHETSLLVPQFLHERGVRQVIPPVKTLAGALWARMDLDEPDSSVSTVLYPFITGTDGWDSPLTAAQFREFGAALRGVHSAPLPADLRARIAAETFSDRFREQVRAYQSQAEGTAFADPIAAEMASVLRARRREIDHAVRRAGELAALLLAQDPGSPELPFVLCHSDIHGGNLLLAADGSLYIIDWDEPILAPKERDLMFIGAGIGGVWDTPREEALFYAGYGAAPVNRSAIAYYRYERIIQDIAAFCDQILPTTGLTPDRAQGLRYFASAFGPGSVLDRAVETDVEGKEF